MATCSAVLTYFDGAGTRLKTYTLIVAPGTVGYLDLFSDTDLALAADQRKQIRVSSRSGRDAVLLDSVYCPL
jgi:hypothetical protein